ncbi:YciI family protein [Chitinophaga sp.]|uniref:YciI family protein n=1 Tax=Chitinophaga sp. TaxID=1869181 RepID=UPI0031DCB4F5
MEKFMLLIREDLQKLKEYTDKDRNHGIKEMTEWVEGLAVTGNFIGGEPLWSEGRYVTKNEIVSDGPFIEAKEGVSGYIMISAENLEQAAALAQTCPILQRGELEIEVRPIMVTDFPNG